MACAGDIAKFKGVGFRSPRYLHSDHRAVVVNIWVGRTGWLKKYRRARQKLPLYLPPGPKDPNTALFDALAAKCVDPKPTRAPGKNWISEGTWKLIRKCASLMRSGKIQQDAAQRMQREVKAVLKANKSRLTAEVGERIVLELREGKVQEAFGHLKGWYRNASETQAKPCHQTMELQTDKRVELYAERVAYGEEFPENGTPFGIDNDPPSEGELRTAVSQLSHDRYGGASGICAEHIKAWLRGAKKAEDPENGINHFGAEKTWDKFVKLCSSVWATGTIPQQMCWVVTVLIPKGGGEYRGIGLLEPIWKVLERAMDIRLEKIILHDSLRGCLAGRGTGTGIIEAKLAQQLAHLEQMPFFGVFIDLKKAFDAMDQGRCLAILALHGVGLKMLRLIRNFWETATNVCRAKGNYGRPFKAGRGVTQGGPLLAKLFNIIVDEVVREWLRLMRETLDDSGGYLTDQIEALFDIFYVDDGYIASRDAEFLQEALDILVETFKCVGLATNTKKTQAMVCTLGKIRVQLPTDSYRCLREGVSAGEESKLAVVCHVCEKTLQARSLRSHLESTHDIYQQVVVPNNLLEERAGIRYEAERVGRKTPIKCPFPGCPGKHSSACMVHRHFRDLHPKLRSYGKDTTHDVSGARCSVIQNTPDKSTRRCVRQGQSGEHRGTRPSRWPWPSDSYSTSKGKCLRKLSRSDTLDESSPRMTTMPGQCGVRLRRLGGYGHEWGKFSRRTTLRRKSAPSSTRQLCSRSSFMEATHGTSQRLHWRGWRGSTSKPPTVWLPNISLGKD